MRYNARKLGASDGPVSYDHILDRDNGCCYLCGDPISPGDLAFDHVIPLSRGGRHAEDNIRPTHKLCNTRKHARTPDEYLAISNGTK